MNSWRNVKNILCIRPDNMGDILMAEPAFRALKTTFEAKITLLTSHSGAKITKFIKDVDDTIVEDLPWIKSDRTSGGKEVNLLAEKIKKLKFDSSVVLTNYSQNSAPSAMLSYLAQIPLRLG